MTTSISGLPIPQWDIADRLRKSLRESDLGVQEMADYLRVSRNTVSAWINGRGPINPDCLPKWAHLTGFPQQWIEHGEGAGPSQPPPGTFIRRHPKARVTPLRAIADVDDDSELVDDDAVAYLQLAEGGESKPRTLRLTAECAANCATGDCGDDFTAHAAGYELAVAA
jgi:transcriptional regulator with XRE-family HTH domain